jgi:hypothetical protein
MLPKIQYPTFTVTIPSTQKKETFRLMLVKEEKILMIAKQSGEVAEITGAIKQIINLCAVSEKFDVNKLAIFDLEYLFLKIRENSVENTVTLAIIDDEDSKEYQVKIDLAEVAVRFPEEGITTKIAINDKSGIIMRYPPASLYDDKEYLAMDPNDSYSYLVTKCIDKMYDETEVFEADLYKAEELKEWFDNLDLKTSAKIREFLENMPSMSYDVKYTNSLGTEKTIALRTITDFFTF